MVRYLSKAIYDFKVFDRFESKYDYSVYMLDCDIFYKFNYEDNNLSNTINIKFINHQQNILEQHPKESFIAFLLIALFSVLSFYLFIMNKKIKLFYKEKENTNKILFQQSKMAAMGEMLGNIAHQWRQPLNALSALFFTVKLKYKSGTLDEEAINDFYSKTGQLINRMNETIDDFRNFFKPEKEKQYFNICESLDNVLNIISPSFENHNIKLNIHCDKKIDVDGYKNELEQVFLVILNNSKDAIKDIKITDGEVKISIFEKNKNIHINIEDNGGGINEKVLLRIFEPYFTTKHQDVGTGRGLYMSKMIIEQSMNGTINMQNSNSGALTTIIFPKEDINAK
jgi:signal transduction histidine kinase